MQTPPLNHQEARSLFGPWVDQELPAQQEERLREHLEDCADCHTGWQRYEKTVLRLRKLSPVRAPDGLASVLARRVRQKRKLQLRSTLAQLSARPPVEILVVLFVAAAVAAVLAFMG